MLVLVMCMTGDNATGADNQQERPGIADWITGFVDGEGTFSVSVYRNRSMSLGWQVFPEFVVTQGIKSLEALEMLREYFDCGRIYRNHRRDNHKSDLARYCVRELAHLTGVIVPFFDLHQLRTSKIDDFRGFRKVIEMMNDGQHLNPDGLIEIAMIAQTMNRRKRSAFLESSETTRQVLNKNSRRCEVEIVE